MHLSLTTLPHTLHRLLRIDRRSGPRGRPVTLNRQRIFILPTRHGLLFGLLALTLLFGSTNYNNSTGFLLSFLLIGLALVSILHTYRNLARLTFRPGRSTPVFCGEPACFTVQVENRARPARSAVALQLEGAQPVLADIPADGETSVTLRRATHRRGRLAMGMLTVSTRYPLGLFRAWSYVTLEASCLVYPRPAAGFVPAPRARQPGGRRPGQAPGHDDFAGHRDYHVADSPRHVDWKALARGQQWLTKVFADDESEELWLDWDELAGTDTETRLSRLCRAVLWAEERDLRYGLHLPATAIALGRGAAHRHRCLEALALFEGAA